MLNIRQILEALRLVPVSTTAISAKGEMEVLDSSGKLNYHNGTTASPAVTEAHTATLTNKTLTGNTAANLISGSGTTVLNTTGTVTLPNATDTLVGKATTDTLTNKTISGNTATNLVSGSGTLTLNTTGTVTVPNATDTLVGKATTDTLTNKTLSGNTATNLISGSGTLTLNTSGTITVPNGTTTLAGLSTNNDFTAAVSVKDISFQIRDESDSSKQIRFDASGSDTGAVTTILANSTDDRTINLFDADDTIVGCDTTDVLTNKTLTAPIISTISNTGTLTLPTSTDTLVGRATTDTLTNKTLTTPVIVGSGGTLTLPAGPDTLVGKATTDTLTNKTLTAPVISTIVNGGTLTLPTGTEFVLGSLSSIFVKNKSFDDATTTIVDETDSMAIAFTAGGTANTTTTIASSQTTDRTITLPNATDTLVGKATTDSFTNKTFGDAVSMTEIATPSAPSAGTLKVYAKTDDKLYTLNSLSVETELGAGGGSGGINYIDNSDAEAGTSGWATYADAAGNVPVNGTAGTATGLTFSRSTSNPLRDTASFSIVQTNSTSLQGMGVSYDFTIDAADKAKMLSISFDYNASSTFVAGNGVTPPLNDGTTSTNAGNSDIEVFIYDTDASNLRLIPVSPQVITANGSNNYTFTGEFQTDSASTTYRLILHCATASANATGYTFKFDNVIVGPQTKLLGPPITDSTEHVVTSSNLDGFGTPTLSTVRYWRQGDRLRMQGYFKAGTTSATPAAIYLPTGLVIDTTKVSTATNVARVGTLYRVLTAAGPNTTGPFAVFFDGTTTNKLFLSNDNNSGSNQLVKRNGADVIATSDGVNFEIDVPIAGWSSTTTMSNDSDTRVVAGKATLSAPSANIATATLTKVPVNTITGGFDKLASFDLTNNRYVIPVSGVYRITTAVCWSSASGLKLTAYKVNGGNANYIGSQTGADRGHGSGIVEVKAGDYVEIWARQDSGGNLTIQNDVENTFFAIERISGPATIAASESVNCRYTSSASMNIPTGSATIVDFGTKDYDSHNAVTVGASWKFTAPISGKYEMKVLTAFANTAFTAGTVVEGRIYKNGVLYSNIDQMTVSASVSQRPRMGGSDDINLLAGDYIDFRLVQSDGGGRNLDSDPHVVRISIRRVGN